MNILIVFVIPCYMAALGRSAPLPTGSSALVADPQSQELVSRSRSLAEKILIAIPDVHKSFIQSEALKLNSSENEKLVLMASTIGIPPAPVLKAVSENFSLETCLTRMSEGLQLHRALLTSVSPPLSNKDKVAGLQNDLRDLVIQINKILRTVRGEAVAPTTPDPITLRMSGTYQEQVAAHLTLVQLQSFTQDLVRGLRGLEQSSEEEEQEN